MTPSAVFVSRLVPQPGLDRLAEGGARVVIGHRDEESPIPRARLVAGVQECDVLLSLLTESVDAELLDANPGLLGVAQMAVGFDNIDVAAATRLGIPVSNTPGVLTETTADLTWALLLAVARRVPEAHRYQVEGRYKLWGPNLFLGADVGPGATDRRKVLGVVGFGRIGRAVARRASGFEMEVLVHTRNRAAIASAPEARWVQLDELLERSDFVTLHTPATQETRHLIGERELRRMKPTAYLINTSRGDVVDEAALVRALTAGDIAGAGLDVYEGEPAMAPGLTAAPGVVLLPHVGSATRGTRGRMATMAADNALAHLRGATAPHAVNPEVYGAAAYRRRRVGR